MSSIFVPKITGTMLDMVKTERRNEPIDKILLKHTVHMLVELDPVNHSVYVKNFEDHFIAAAREFYSNESNTYISEHTCQDFLKKAEARIKEEKARVILH